MNAFLSAPRVSVIMPVFNVEDYIADAIQSVLEQTYGAFELLIIDDAGSDASIEICKLFDDCRIRIISQENRGLAGARNTGIRHARGDLLAFLDSDDLWAPTKLENHVAHFDTSPHLGISYAPSALIDENGKPIGILQDPKLSSIEAQDVFLRNPIGNGSAPVIKRAVLDEIQFENGREYEEYFNEDFKQSVDVECWMRIALETDWTFEGIEPVLTYYRVNAGGLSANVVRQLETWERMAASVKSANPDFYRRWGRISRAFELRYLSRRATRMRDGRKAISLAVQSLVCHFGILLREPRKTIETVGAAVLLLFLPRAVYIRIETLLLNRKANSNA